MPAKRKPGPDPLSTYRAKRSLDRTPEPGARPATAGPPPSAGGLFVVRSEEHTSELQSRLHLVCRLLLEKKNKSRQGHRLHHLCNQTQLVLEHQPRGLRHMYLDSCSPNLQIVKLLAIATHSLRYYLPKR